jgi:hypothetical protein
LAGAGVNQAAGRQLAIAALDEHFQVAGLRYSGYPLGSEGKNEVTFTAGEAFRRSHYFLYADPSTTGSAALWRDLTQVLPAKENFHLT